MVDPNLVRLALTTAQDILCEDVGGCDHDPATDECDVHARIDPGELLHAVKDGDVPAEAAGVLFGQLMGPLTPLHALMAVALGICTQQEADAVVARRETQQRQDAAHVAKH